MKDSKDKHEKKIPVFRNLGELRDFLMIGQKRRSRFKSILLLSNGLDKSEIINEFSSQFKIYGNENLIHISKSDPKTKKKLFTGYIWFFPTKPFSFV